MERGVTHSGIILVRESLLVSIKTSIFHPSDSPKMAFHQKFIIFLSVVPRVGIEPTRYRYHRILNPARLPIPPPRPLKDEASISNE
jgi:hypothetical protein